VNNSYQKISGAMVTAEVYNFALDRIFTKQASVDVEADDVKRVVAIPEFAGSTSPIFFVRLRLEDQAGKIVSSNFYWLSSKPAKIEWAKTVYFDDPPPPDTTNSTSIYTPASPYDDLRSLNQLPRVRVYAAASVEQTAGGPRVRVKISNPSSHLAFQICLGIRQKNQAADILPVIWEDNYFELMPGESRELTARYLTAEALKGSPELVIGGWNVEPVSVAIGETGASATTSTSDTQRVGANAR
jgi:exo-1,4-beta-D-glucosaminidase